MRESKLFQERISIILVTNEFMKGDIEMWKDLEQGSYASTVKQ